MHLLRRILCCTMLLAAFPGFAQEPDASCVSPLMAGEEKFFVLFQGNDTERPLPEAGAQALTKAKPCELSLRANLLRWVTLTPDLGVECRINKRIGILVNGSWTSWSWSDKDRRYALWEVAPEVRLYLGKKQRGYLGAMYKTGDFNYKFSKTGKQGDIMGGGITGGYVLQLNKALSLDFSLGLGYMHADCEKYNVIEGVRVHAGNEKKNWWGPIAAGVTLTWNIF